MTTKILTFLQIYYEGLNLGFFAWFHIYRRFSKSRPEWENILYNRQPLTFISNCILSGPDNMLVGITWFSCCNYISWKKQRERKFEKFFAFLIKRTSKNFYFCFDCIPTCKEIHSHLLLLFCFLLCWKQTKLWTISFSNNDCIISKAQ